MSPRKRKALDRVPSFHRSLLKWFGFNRRDLPWRRRASAYRCLLVEILLQRTPVEKVLPVYKKLCSLCPTPASLEKVQTSILRKLLRPLGLVGRAEVLKGLGLAVVSRFSGRIPHERRDLLSLPGVGEYTAAAVRCFAFGDHDVLVDTNVIRVLVRYFGLPKQQKSNGKLGFVKRVASELLAVGNGVRTNQALLDFGGLVCRYRYAKCWKCPLSRGCRSYSAGRDLAGLGKLVLSPDGSCSSWRGGKW